MSAKQMSLATLAFCIGFLVIGARYLEAVTYTYDKQRRLTSATYATGKKIVFTHDKSGNIDSQTVTANATAGTVQIIASPAHAAWAFTDAAGITHKGSGNATVTDIPAGTIHFFWGSLGQYRSPWLNPVMHTLAGPGAIVVLGAYISKDTSARLWAMFE